MSNAIIAAHFEGILATWAAAQSPAIPVAYESVPFTKPTTRYLECFLIPANTKDVTVDGTRQRYMGTFQINVWVPDGKGRGAGDVIAAALVDLFPIVPKTGNVSVETTPTVSRAIKDVAGWRVIPVTLTYRLEV